MPALQPSSLVDELQENPSSEKIGWGEASLEALVVLVAARDSSPEVLPAVQNSLGHPCSSFGTFGEPCCGLADGCPQSQNQR